MTMSLQTDQADILKYFTQKQYFPSLASWSFTLDELYYQFPTLRSLIVEGIDLKDSPTLSFNEIRNELYEKLGIVVKVDPGAEKAHIEHDPDRMVFEGLSMSVTQIAKQAVRDGTITLGAVLTDLAQRHYYNKVLKHRFMGFSAEALIPDAYWHWDWAASIGNLCTSILPVFERLVKRELFLFPEIDKPIKETMSAANSFCTFIQSQSPQVRTEEIILDETDEATGKAIVAADINKPKGGILVGPGSHILMGDVLADTKDGSSLRLDLGPEEQQMAWTVAKIYMRPGEVLTAGKRLMVISALTARVEQARFMKLFYDLYRQVGRIRKTAMFLKEAIEEEIRSGGGMGGSQDNESGGTGGGYKPVSNRFANLDLEPAEIDKTAADLQMEKKEVSSAVKKIRSARARASAGG